MKLLGISGVLTLAVVLAALDEPPKVPSLDDLPTPTPTPGAVRLVAAIESHQGLGTEKTALFDDGTVVHVVRHREREQVFRRVITTNERDLVQGICLEALQLSEGTSLRTPVLPEGARRFRLEIVEPGSPRSEGRTPAPASAREPRVFEFGELTPLPLLLGRARQALEDLRARFYEDAGSSGTLWDPAGVRAGDLLRRRRDGKWFAVHRDDSFERNLELVESEASLERLFVLRADLPKQFEDPEGSAAARSVEPTPRAPRDAGGGAPPPNAPAQGPGSERGNR